MGTKSRDRLYGTSVRMAVERAVEARKQAAKRMLAFKGPAQPSATLGDALNAGYAYLEVRCFGRDTHQTFALDITRRPKATPIHELERYMRCKIVLKCTLSVQAEPSGCASTHQQADGPDRPSRSKLF